MPIPFGGASGATVTVEIAFDTTPFATTPTWTEVTDYVDTREGINIQRGRTDEQDQVGPGLCTFVLNNDDKRFTPGYTSGPYGSGVRPRKKVRVTVQYNSATYRRFTGWIQSWELNWPGGVTQTNRVRVVATDLLGVLEQRSLATALTEVHLASSPVACWPLTEREAPGFDFGDYDQPRLRRISRRGGGTVRFGDADGNFPSRPSQKCVYIKNGVDTDYQWSALTAVTSFESATTAVGFGFWMKWDAPTPASITDYIASLGIDGTDSLVVSIQNTGEIYASVYDFNVTVSESVASDRTVTDGKWHFVAVKYTETGSGVVSISVDGEAFINSSAIGVGFPTVGASGQFTVGAGYDGTTKLAAASRRMWVSHPTVWTDDYAVDVDVETIWDAGRRNQSRAKWAHSRVSWLLDMVGFPSADRSVDKSVTEIPTDSADRSSAASYLRDVANGERGVFFSAGDGTATFHGRQHRWTATSECTLSWHQPDEAWTTDIDSVVNIADVSYRDGAVKVKDAASILAYGPRNQSVSTELLNSNYARGTGQYMLELRSTPQPRLSTFTWDLLTWPTDGDNEAVLDLEIDDRFTVDNLPPQAVTE